MKLILSRKGFDSSFGGCASPIFEDGSFVSLPIPEKSARMSFSDVGGNRRIEAVVEDLTEARKKPLKANDHVHLDPDLRIESRPRKPGWRPLFGQADAAQRHLDNHGVEVGDTFLFFGWFRRVENRDGGFRFKPGAPDIHMFFGWLEIGAIWRLWKDRLRIPNWASEHPHANADYPRNTIYVAAGNGTTYNGGTFHSYSDQLVLTEPGKSRSRWRLPKWFYPAVGKAALSYHGNVARWSLSENCADLQSVARGQEFVLDGNDYPEAVEWAKRLIAENG
ncbi:MAG TPA: hypothetical protein DCK99_08695 [Blastocatellia bacterium]|jgi:hypothetical protein|nr:hypothetical protein [Blastocatellia bacterium]